MSRGEGGAADGPVGNMTDEERLLYLRSDRWIGYPRAEAILDQLDRLLAFPRNVRMPGLLVLGESGIGKTMIVDRFCRMHPQQVKAAPRGTTMPVVSVQGPGSGVAHRSHVLDGAFARDRGDFFTAHHDRRSHDHGPSNV